MLLHRYIIIYLQSQCPVGKKYVYIKVIDMYIKTKQIFMSQGEWIDILTPRDSISENQI